MDAPVIGGGAMGSTRNRFDYVIVGGGLQGCLLLLALAHRKPDHSMALVERSASLCGNHTWCFHGGDVPTQAYPLLRPLIVSRWQGYEVRFPGRRARFSSEYFRVTSERLAAQARSALDRAPRRRRLVSAHALEVGGQTVYLDEGRPLEGRVIVDARGPALEAPVRAGWQKFVGQELQLALPHGIDVPTLMDATVQQTDGFRFFYVLPLSRDGLLVEETRFSHGPHLDLGCGRRAISDYARARGWSVRAVKREEHGVLPMPWGELPAAPEGSPLVAGYRGGWFHPATAYSFGVASKLALFVAERPLHALWGPALQELHARHLEQVRYAQLLNRLLFHCFAPEQMWNVFDRFYRLPPHTIERFYALDLGPLERARILLGRPPRGMSFPPLRVLKEAIA